MILLSICTGDDIIFLAAISTDNILFLQRGALALKSDGSWFRNKSAPSGHGNGSRRQIHAYSLPSTALIPGHVQPCHSLPGRFFYGFGTRQQPRRERKVYGYGCLFSSKPTSALFFCELPLWENCKGVKFPSLFPMHFIYQRAKLGTEPPLTQLVNDSIFSGQLCLPIVWLSWPLV